ncbi:EF-hand-containing protein [Dioscorea alata]|uniref:EF-hand-containing protein n=1 Tax=Dioscorea alata TaxID=55571 RepID=A0ACB7WGY3_DIOAL|nr:EF-hand-containing protein [Dioscorea alata]
MGQVFGSIQDMLHGRKWREKQIRKITDKVFDRIKEDSGKDTLTFEDVCIAVLYVYNDINKYLPGPHNNPPSKAELRALMQEYDVNLNGLLDREEFADFIQKLTTDMLTAVSRNLVIALIVAPAVALLTKRATEGVPGVGKVVQKVPNSVYASVVTLGVVLIQNSSEGFE